MSKMDKMVEYENERGFKMLIPAHLEPSMRITMSKTKKCLTFFDFETGEFIGQASISKVMNLARGFQKAVIAFRSIKNNKNGVKNMPNRDGTGPNGKGRKSGRKKGNC